jgi:hypothetical protein
MIRTIAIDDSYDLIVAGTMLLAVAPKLIDPFIVFIDSSRWPVFYREEIAILLAATKQGTNAKGKRWELVDGILSGLTVDLASLSKILIDNSYLYDRSRKPPPLSDDRLFSLYGNGIRTLSGIIPILGVTSEEFIERDSQGFWRENANSF